MNTFDLPTEGEELESPSGFPTLSILEQKNTECLVVQFSGVPYESVQEIANLLKMKLPVQIQAVGYELASPLLTILHKIMGQSTSQATVNMSVGYAVEEAPKNPEATAAETTELTPLELQLPSAIKELLVSEELKKYTLPAGRVAALSYFHHKTKVNQVATGSAVLFAAWEDLLTKLTDRGLSPLAPMWEVYAAGRTDLFVPLGWSTPPV